MKKILILLIIILLSSTIVCILDKKEVIENQQKNKEERAVFISYIDYGFLKGKTKEEQQNSINKMIDNIYNLNFNMIILQVRPFCDAIYNSSIFSSSKVLGNEGDKLKLDILDYFITKSHEKGIKVHAWVNPYRIRSFNSIKDISKNNIIYSWLSTNKIERSNSGIYLNPADQEVLNLILNGIKEIVENYDVDGIIYDDYFYPTETIDDENYKEYKDSGGTLTLKEYRINNINNLISESYATVKNIKKEVLFGISPAGNINNNLDHEYLDIAFILSNNNYLDYVMPQIYYGFLNDTAPFLKTIKVWNDLILNNETKLYLALSLYKSGMEDKYAINGKKEWIENSDIIKNQIIASRGLSNYEGFAIFRYDFLVYEKDNNANLLNEIFNIKELLK